MNTYPKGSKVRVPFEFRLKSDNSLADPATVAFSWRAGPEGALTTYIYGTDAAIVRSAVGQYYVELDLNLVAVYQARAYATGIGQSAEEREIGSGSFFG